MTHNETLIACIGILVACSLVLLAAIGVFGLSLKLYTEMLKDQSMNRRMSKKQDEPKPHTEHQ